MPDATLKYHGPFLGLNTAAAISQLGPAYARVARNVVLTEGRIRPRGPLGERPADVGGGGPIGCGVTGAPGRGPS